MPERHELRTAPPGLLVGVLGAGQLGRMLALSGIPLGMRFKFYSDVASVPASAVGDVTVAKYDDKRELLRFAKSVDVITYEFENVPVDAVDIASKVASVWPPRSALLAAQDRAEEKRLFATLGIATAPYKLVDSLEGLREAVATIGAPGILKTRRFGYDGKGQWRVNHPSDLVRAWAELGGVPLIYEGLVKFERELAVLAVRGRHGEMGCYPVVETRQRDGILREALAPAAALSPEKRDRIAGYARAITQQLDYVGVLALEMFETSDGLVANEMAPRVHNSGHWTIEGAETSQFENHMRAVCGLPLGSCEAVGHSAMFNIIGEHPDVSRVLSVPDVHVHLYGKSGRPGRKLGHVTIRSRTEHEVQDRVAALRPIIA